MPEAHVQTRQSVFMDDVAWRAGMHYKYNALSAFVVFSKTVCLLRLSAKMERVFRRCVPPCQMFLTLENMRCVSFAWEWSMSSQLLRELTARIARLSHLENSAPSWPLSPLKSLHPTVQIHLHSWGLQLDLADELETGLSFSSSSLPSSQIPR